MSNILVVDDEPTLAANIARYLRMNGHQVALAHDLRSAREALRETRFDALCLDIRLPDGNGLELLREIRQHDRETDVLVITGDGESTSEKVALTQGATAVLKKPFALSELAIFFAETSH
ncbi:MAG: response regulator [Gammaproteobacteria bacterium]|nr:response regulator [Gammaproteobacteria bacterium]